MSEAYVIGQTKRVWGIFTDVAAAQSDPDALVFEYRAPRAEIVSLVYGTDEELVKASGTVTIEGVEYDADAGGIYYVDLVLEDGTDGIWYWRWESTGTPTTALEGTFPVAASVFD